MTSLVDDALALPRLAQSLLGKLASIGLGLAILGLFAVVSYSVRIRRAELGIRLAIGATPLRLQRELVSQVAPLIAFGLAVGSVLGVSRAMSHARCWHGVSPGDPVSIVVAVGVVATAALTAAYLPVRTVATIEPALSIRET